MSKFFYTLVLFAIVTSSVRGQDCWQRFEQAQKSYYNGQLEAFNTMSDCFGILTKGQQVQMLRSMIIADLIKRDDVNADSNMLHLLQIDKLYKPTSIDPPDFERLYNSFRTQPILSLGFKVGGYKNYVVPKTVSGTYNITSDFKPNYVTEVEFHFGITVDKVLKPWLTANFEIFWSNQNIYKWVNHTITPDLSTSRLETNIQAEFMAISENQQWLQLPLSVQFHLPDKDFQPYIGIGIATEYLLKSYIDTENSRRIIEIDNGLGRVYTGTYDLINEHNRLIFAPTFEVGLKQKLGLGYFTANFRYTYGVMDLGKKEIAYNVEAIWELAYTNDIYRKNQSAINIGYLFNIYHIKKRKNNTKK